MNESLWITRRWAKMVACAIIAAPLTACQTTTQPPEEQRLWSRTDCQIMSGNAALQRQYETDTTLCQARARAEGLTVAATMRAGPMVTAAVSGEVLQQAAIACMAERGYLLHTDAQFKARCQTGAVATRP
jgi:hypothetical protein